MTEDRLSPDKQRLGFALTSDAQKLLKQLKAKLGISQNGVVELAIRRLAQAEGVEAGSVAHAN
jgi:hypothetical protein